MAAGVVVSLSFLSACQTTREADAGGTREEKAAQDAGALQGESNYEAWQCALCHGENREGTDLAPPLTHIHGRWQADEIAAYLLDPESFRRTDPRLQELQRYYPEVTMPPFDYPEKERLAVATWLLERSRAGEARR